MDLVVAVLVLIAVVAALVVTVRYVIKLKGRHAALMVDYSPVAALKTDIAAIGATYADLQAAYKAKRSALQSHETVINTYSLGVGTVDVSTYQPLHNTRDVSVLEAELAKAKEQARALVSAKRACVSRLPKDLAINGRKGAAKTFVNREIRLRIRCLDNEVKAAMAAMEWNNINRLIDRVRGKFEQINHDSKLVKIFLEKKYLEARVLELRLHYEIKQLKASLKEEEREERQRLREEERDAERVKRELAKAEKDRARMEKLVAEELAKIGEATHAQKELLALHQKELELLKAKETRAMSLAQQTRAGFVYVISNPTSFGDGICKIGMTRRLDPNDRVKELGDASVPERFTVHAFIYTEDAPALEKYFHNYFDERRVNLVNRRKEFFRVSPEDALGALNGYKGPYDLEVVA